MDTQKYWEDRLTVNTNLRGTGHRAFGMEYNNWLYQAQTDTLDMLLARNDVDVLGKSALDVGSGTGFFVDYWTRKGASPIVGSDVTDVSVRHLQETFPQHTFLQYDVSRDGLPLAQNFDIISIISVLYHVLDDEGFNRAIQNLCEKLSPGGYLIASDTLTKSILPTASHARHRLVDDYRRAFAQYDVKILDVVPVYYLLNRTFVPLIGPKLLDLFGLGKHIYKFDRQIREQGVSNGDGMKLFLAQKQN